MGLKKELDSNKFNSGRSHRIRANSLIEHDKDKRNMRPQINVTPTTNVD